MTCFKLGYLFEENWDPYDYVSSSGKVEFMTSMYFLSPHLLFGENMTPSQFAKLDSNYS